MAEVTTETRIGAVVVLAASSPLLSLLQGASMATQAAPVWDSRTRALMGNGLELAGGVTLGALALAVAVLTVLTLTPSPRLRLLLLLVVGAIYCLPPVIHLSAWQALGLPLNLSPGFNAGLVLAWSYFPLALFILWLGLLELDPAGLEAGSLLATPAAILQHLVLPPLRPAFMTAAVLIFLLVSTHAEVPSLTGYPVYAEEFLARLVLETDTSAALILALPLLIILVVAAPLLGYLKRGLLAQNWRLATISTWMRLWPPCRMGNYFAILALIVLILPTGALAIRAQWAGFIEHHGSALVTSLGLGLPSAILATVLAHLSADALVNGSTSLRLGLLILVLLQFLLPGSLLGLGTLELAQQLSGGARGDSLLIVTHALRVFPLLTLILAGLRGPRVGEDHDVVRLLGVGWIQRQRYLRLPRERSRLLFTASVALALVMAELPTTVLVVAPGTETTVLRLYNLMHYGDWRTVAALACADTGLVLTGVIMASLAMGVHHARH